MIDRIVELIFIFIFGITFWRRLALMIWWYTFMLRLLFTGYKGTLYPVIDIQMGVNKHIYKIGIHIGIMIPE